MSSVFIYIKRFLAKIALYTLILWSCTVNNLRNDSWAGQCMMTLFYLARTVCENQRRVHWLYFWNASFSRDKSQIQKYWFFPGNWNFIVYFSLQMRKLWYDTSANLCLDNLLLVVAQTGVFIYSAFCIIGAFFQLEDHLLAFLASLATLVQTTLQTVFILDSSSRFACTNEQVKRKPGRQVVTFLLVCNLAMWAINTLETNRADSHPIQVKFYGGEWAWPIITHVSMPLAIFYRFHSTVCLCEIWKKSFKFKN